jgi:glucosyl-dolichyl phosphate glucuronosyltransferase
VATGDATTPEGHDAIAGTESPELDVAICTYNNARMLDRVLTALAAQVPAAGVWRVTVVDNNSTDDTREVVERHVALGAIPGLGRVEEHTQGLTPARLRAVSATTAAWLAFVDDDCILDQSWIARAVDFARAHADCGAFGGRVVPTYPEEPPAVLADYGWAFAEQVLGDDPFIVDCLVGAGMVVNRSALDASGWTRGPFFADRVGGKLVSGGDVEIALRIAGTGRALWYVPACRLQHVIPARRTTMPYLVRMTHGLGISHSLAGALTWHRSRRAWLGHVARGALPSLRLGLKLTKRAARGPDAARRDAMFAASYEWGRWVGFARVAALLATRRCDFFGRDRPESSGTLTRRGRGVRAA